ncbi:MAG: arabinogalactan endo-1,4-beta-galactosidase [Armatimonadota bacterium]|nr:arabinogalactan endo-1,4-beta-galactosidase [Armatimonadota bacterium]
MQDTQFIKGMDLSMLQYIEDHGVQYKEAGKAKDALVIFQDHGINSVHLRLFVNPDGKAGQVNILPYTLKLAKRVKQAGLKFLLDFHYSDEWADPGHQTIPAAWKSLSHSDLVAQVFTYTRDTLAAFQEEDCLPDMVQVSNEITNGMMWPASGPISDAATWNDITSQMAWPEGADHPNTPWDALADFVNAGIRGVHAGDPQKTIKIMVHVDKGGNQEVCWHFFDHLQRREVQFDVIGLSYYPFWHGTLTDLKDNLAFLAAAYGKGIIVVETGYDWNGGEQGTLPFPMTPDGQKAFLEDLIRTVADTPGGHGQGVVYWAPEWIMGPKWDGADWSKTWENRALFDETGNMLPGLEAFAQ